MSEYRPYVDESEESAARFRRGARILEEVNDVDAHRLLAAFADVAPHLGRYIVEFAYGDIYSRPGLDPRRRELVVLGALTALGREPEVEIHLHSALNVGLTPVEIVEALVQVLPYAGFPPVQSAVMIARRVFAERDVLPPRE
ncbi:carboxymuconolactone decarboxylase family protein [Nocardia terpenica]|uniref:carboxymuconolactone decarboxylase family protein n=1 Tax=Nocardia terpenica TaxID=455432 RepID=UPI001EEC5850|nr:carboxymuconolactone decarboxylase family protein [Nocardia terpenica]